jgi:SAM-dependent methyltransferase
LADILALITEPTPDGLAPFDQLHSGGLSASRLLARRAGIRQGEALLDAGCGVGGSARLLAAEFGASVTGVDLSPAYIEIARALANRTGTPGRFECADLLDLPFADASFDTIWSQHAATNIRAKRNLYLELKRVLRQGGRFAFHDLQQGAGGQPYMPLPFADTAEESFLSDNAEQRALLAELGFRELLWQDRTAATQAFFRNLPEPESSKGALGLHLLLGPEFPVMLANIKRSFAEHRLGAAMGVYQLD